MATDETRTEDHIAALDQLMASYRDLWAERWMDLTGGDEDDELVALRSALLTLEVLDARSHQYDDLRDALAEVREVLNEWMFPPHLGFAPR